MHPILFRIPVPFLGTLPIYSYGVMLGLSFIVGWYLTLGLAKREGLPRETMANCYVVTALSAVVASRLLYVLTNLSDFHSIGEVFQIRSGGMVAYGGFLGGFLGSWAFLRWKNIPLIPWADVAVPSLASGLLITRIGCYLYGCDFGRELSPNAPQWLKNAGSFPRWKDIAADESGGSPAWVQHWNAGRLSPTDEWSLPVHPTQLYESLVGLTLLVFLLTSRRFQSFRGQIFLYFTFLYGVARFVLEFLRDDAERGDVWPALPPAYLFGLSFLLFAVAFGFGISTAIKNPAVRTILRVGAFAPIPYIWMKMQPGQYETTVWVKLSTSQFIGLISAFAASIAFALLYRNAQLNPAGAMALPNFTTPEDDDGDEDKDADKAPAKARAKAKAKDKDADKGSETKKAKRTVDADPLPEDDAEAGAAKEEPEPEPDAAPAPLPKKKKKKKKPAPSDGPKDGGGEEP